MGNVTRLLHSLVDLNGTIHCAGHTKVLKLMTF